MYIASIALLLTSLVGLPLVTPNDEDMVYIKLTTEHYTSTSNPGGSRSTSIGWTKYDLEKGKNGTLDFDLYMWDNPAFTTKTDTQLYHRTPDGHAKCHAKAKRKFTNEVEFTFSTGIATGFDFDGEKSDDVRVWCDTLSGSDLGKLAGVDINSDDL